MLPFPRLLLFLSLAGTLIPMSARAEIIFTGMCDASAAAALDADHFIIADDEVNLLRIYARTGGAPVATVDVAAFLNPEKKKKEADLEAAAQIGTRTFWISSHGRNSKGRETPERQRIFATEMTKTKDGKFAIKPVGQPYAGLLDELLKDPRLARFKLAEAAARAPKTAGALNIEGLAATPDGHLLIGFRNPIPDGQAIIVPLQNPHEVIEGKAAKLGDPVLLNLDGFGIRSLGYFEGRYLIIAGHFDSEPGSRLYEWAGGKAAPKRVGDLVFEGLNPEGVAFQAPGGKGQYLVLSDDGSRQVDGQDCKSLKDDSQKRFRGTVLALP